MAELTRHGHVYIISNVGSFGDGIFKIGLTRRLNPMERVKELGDASVPFLFDVHAFVLVEDAPALEKALHLKFTSRRVNAVNLRKEFFKVELEDIKEAVEELAGSDVDFKLTLHTDIVIATFLASLVSDVARDFVISAFPRTYLRSLGMARRK